MPRVPRVLRTAGSCNTDVVDHRRVPNTDSVRNHGSNPRRGCDTSGPRWPPPRSEDDDRSPRVDRRTTAGHAGTHNRVVIRRRGQDTGDSLQDLLVRGTNASRRGRRAHRRWSPRDAGTRPDLGARPQRGERVLQSTGTARNPTQGRQKHLRRGPGNLTKDTTETIWTILTRCDCVCLLCT